MQNNDISARKTPIIIIKEEVEVGGGIACRRRK
jgi:hypothetical protein